MSTIIIITPPKRPQVQPQGAPVGPAQIFATMFEVPDDLSPADQMRNIADQLDAGTQPLGVGS